MNILELIALVQAQPNQPVRYYVTDGTDGRSDNSYAEHALCAACYCTAQSDNADGVLWETMHIDHPLGPCWTCKAGLHGEVDTGKLSFQYPEEFHRLTQGQP